MSTTNPVITPTMQNLLALRSRLLRNIDRVETNLTSLKQQLAGADALIEQETKKK